MNVEQNTPDLEELERQIDRLANFIMHKIEGEPSESQGAVDTAIRIMEKQAREADELRTLLASIANAPDAACAREETAWEWRDTARAALGEAK